MPYAIITENDISKWEDQTGLVYHFPNRYLKHLQPNTDVVYYKGRLKDRSFRGSRLADGPYYFGIARIDKLHAADTSSHYATLKDFVLFTKAVPFKIDGKTIERIPESKKVNYWRDGVRPSDERTYNRILELSDVQNDENIFNDIESSTLGFDLYEGGKRIGTSTYYERNRKIRDQVIEIQGYTCKACGFNFKETYGDWGAGYIHVHHLNPVAANPEKKKVNPEFDLAVLCANCHAMVHRRKNTLLSIEDLIKMIKQVRR
jgi:putative restriction endonuclease